MTLIPLLLSLALSQGLTTLRPGQVASGGDKVLASFPFSTTGCLATGTGGVDITRATKGTINANGDGYTLTECASNEYRVATDGLFTEGVKKNYAKRSNTITTGTNPTSGWNTMANVTIATVAGAPMGGTWAELTSTDTVDSFLYAITGSMPAGSTTFVSSVWAAASSGTTTASVLYGCGGGGDELATACACTRSDAGACTASLIDLGGLSGFNNACQGTATTVGVTPVRIAIATTCDAAATAGIVFLTGGEYGVSTGTARFGGAQQEAGVTTPSSLIVTTSTAVQRNADVVSATVPSVPSKGWCIAGTFKPAFAWPNALSLWTLGANYNDANAASSWGNSSLYISDAASGVKDLGAFPSTPVAPWRIVTCNKSGALSAYVNSVLVDETATGAGTGILTTPATTLRFGSQTGGGTISDWYIKDVKVCSGGWKTCK